MRRKINLGVIGYGKIGKRCVEIIKAHPDLELIAISEILSIPDLTFNCKTYSSIDELLAPHLPIDIMVIASPTGLHEVHAILCLRNDYNVIIEKPVALHFTGAKKIYKGGGLSGRKAFAVLQNGCSPLSIEVKNILEKKMLGNIFMVNVNLFWNRNPDYYKKSNWHGTNQLGGGTLFTQFLHYIDQLYWFFGHIQNISGRATILSHQQSLEFVDTGME